MEKTVHDPEVYDFRQYDRIWQRVAPTLEPYPRQEAAVPAMAEQAPGTSTPPAPPENQLPGAAQDPCCMGSAAAEMLEVLMGFIEEELADQQRFLALSRQAPAWARQRLREMAADEGLHARRLLAVYYLITGACGHPAAPDRPVFAGRWCEALRERYHGEACNGLNYARAAEGTTDPCLSRLLNELSDDEYRHAGELMRMLERSLRG
ncbi:ferritin-like domain-containing protein [uncultured Dysosmobacter sp.]|uniref:ferritin-like domain-containing protein n=1 Tax=uncultured Dysosmobacter sp. TaxID=2591384 RepID=UPI00262FC476|nr:ferritin-like domain-containing protein [uncultured Dysosmobacter sp.]